MPRWADSGGPVRVSSTQRSAYWARLVHTFWPVDVPGVAGPGGPAGQSGQIAAGAGLGEALAPGLVPAEQPGHHGRRQLRGGVVDHGGGQHLGHGVDARLDQVPGGQGLTQIGPEQGGPSEPADGHRPSPAHPSGLVGELLDPGQLGHLAVQGLGRRTGPEVPVVPVEPDVERRPELVELHQTGRRGGSGRVVGPPGVTGAALPQEGHRPGVQPPALGGAAVGVGVVADAHVVVRLVDEAQGLLPGAGVALDVEGRGPHQEQPLGGRRHQGREVGQGVGVSEGAVGAVRSEHLQHRLDVVLGHGDGIAGQQLLELDDVGHRDLPHQSSSQS